MKSHILPLIAASVTFPAMAATVDLSSSYWVQYGDAQSYSLPIAGFHVQSGPGQINDYIVVATSANGIGGNTTGLDNAYNTPNSPPGVQFPTNTFFKTDSLTYRGTNGTVANNDINTWDASLSSMKSFLNGEQMAVFFNNNQVNSGGTSLQSLASWARIWVTDNTNQVVTANGINNGSGYFYLTNNLGKYDLVSMGGGGTFLGDVRTFSSSVTDPTGGTAARTDFVLSGGQICTLTISGIPTPVPCGTPGASQPINHNLGANEAAYAVIFPELNALLNGLFGNLTDNALQNYTLHADIRLGCGFKPITTDGRRDEYDFNAANLPYSMECLSDAQWGNGLNNGFEQIFIGTAALRNQVPEPSTLLLAGLALLGSAAFGTRKRNSQ